MSYNLNFSTEPIDGLDHQLHAGYATGRSEEIFWLLRVRRS